MKLTVEELIKIAKKDVEDTNVLLKVEPRELKQVEAFIADAGIKHGNKKIHNVIVYSVYKTWSKENSVSIDKFNKSFSHYFPKKKDAANNTVYSLCAKHKEGKFNTSRDNLSKCRSLYGRKKLNEEKKKPKTEI